MGNPHARDIRPNANRIHAAVRNAGGRIVLTHHSRVPPTAAATSSPQAPTTVWILELIPGSSSYEIHPNIVRAPGIETLIITGLVTDGCCDCTARDAFQHGFNGVIASDAAAAMTDDEHNAALLNLEIY